MTGHADQHTIALRDDRPSSLAIWLHVVSSILALALVTYKVAESGRARLARGLDPSRFLTDGLSLLLAALAVPLLATGVALLFFPGSSSATAYAHLIGSAWCAAVCTTRWWPARWARLRPLLWYATILYCLPFFFTFMLLMNAGAPVWLVTWLCGFILLAMIVDFFGLVVLLAFGGPQGGCECSVCPRWDLRWLAGFRAADVSRYLPSSFRKAVQSGEDNVSTSAKLTACRPRRQQSAMPKIWNLRRSTHIDTEPFNTSLASISVA